MAIEKLNDTLSSDDDTAPHQAVRDKSAVRDQPNELDDWLQQSEQAADTYTALEYAQRAVGEHPDDPRVHQSIQRHVLTTLNQDAFVAFLAETDQNYVISFRHSRPVMVPKVRSKAEVFPTSDRTPGEKALGQVWWVVLGLVPLGLGALILAPMVLQSGWRALNARQADGREQRLGWLTIFLTLNLAGLGAFFTLLLILHLIG